MAAASTVLELCMFVPVALLGVVQLATGRPVPGMRRDIPEGLPARLFGLLYVMLGAGISWWVLRNGVPWDTVLLTYFFLAIGAASKVQRSRKATASRS